jgi:hypothetical protein
VKSSLTGEFFLSLTIQQQLNLSLRPIRFVKGLSCAAYYHPIAMGRLVEMEKNRRAPRRSYFRCFT